ncbi:phosphate/phosphite/phosphonate ABC transporter substrate-binding protein [Dongia sp.]|uniref:phosphate/phosphite/phosphonate ABC transporter substrate-binding protein n=1 Tax=Dongia sp. TaxID=1977262 RepID=UPI0035B25546
MIAALPMYDFPELKDATDAFWQGLRSHFAAAGVTNLPEQLTRPQDPYPLWLSRDLVFAQTCGYPLTHVLKGRVRYLATPCFKAEGCEGSAYRSFIIVRADDPAATGADLGGRIAAFNSRDSQSGYNVLKHYLAGQGIANGLLREALESGAHRQSVKMVKQGLADFCAIDCVSWALLGAVAPDEAAGLRVLDQTAPAPSLPYITGLDRPVEDVAALRSGLAAVFGDPDLADIRDQLLLDGVSVLDEDAYDVIPEQEMAARLSGWAQVA